MQLFYAPDLDPASGSYLLGEEESKHAVRVLRLGRGDSLWVTDGRGAMCRAEIADDSPRGCRLEILGCEQGFGKTSTVTSGSPRRRPKSASTGSRPC